MTHQTAFKLNFGKLLVIGAAGLLAVSVPLVVGIARAQDSLKFEVATVKLGDPGKRPDGRVLAPIVTGGIGSSDPEQISYQGIWLANLVANAYGVRADYITGPDWLPDQRYDIIAKIPPGTTKEQFSVMLQNLLRERFHLSFHRETKKEDVYALVVGKKGSKLTPYIAPAPPSSVDGPRMASTGRDADGFLIPSPTYVGTMAWPSAGHLHISGQGVAVKDMTGWLQDATGRPVVDATGLTGTYDFKLSYARSAQRGATGLAEPGADIFGAVSEQLGLELESRNVPVEVLAIDSLDRQPTEN